MCVRRGVTRLASVKQPADRPERCLVRRWPVPGLASEARSDDPPGPGQAPSRSWHGRRPACVQRGSAEEAAPRSSKSTPGPLGRTGRRNQMSAGAILSACLRRAVRCVGRRTKPRHYRPEHADQHHKVDLPDHGPITATISPLAMDKSAPPRAWVSPKDLTTSRASMRCPGSVKGSEAGYASPCG